MIFLGPVFPRELENEILECAPKGISNAASTFQWAIIDGLCDNLGDGLTIINALPVGTWPKWYKRIILPSRKWQYRGSVCHEIGAINIPILKQLTRTVRTARTLRKLKEEKEIVVCTTYLPFLLALKKLPSDIKITAIITDIPEYSDMHRVSALRGFLRRLNNKLVYGCMKRIDRFVLLTEKMKEPLKVGDRPYTVVEGILGSAPEKVDVGDEAKHFLYSGRLNARYGLDNLLKAFSAIDNENIELWICGSGEMENRIADAEKKDARIKYMGFLPHNDALALQSRADVMVNPRENNGEYTKYSFPSKTIEYMASGKPVVMYKLDGVPSEYDEYLFYVEVGGVEGLKKKLEEVCNMDASARKAKALAGRAFVIEEKSCRKQTAKILKLIKEN